MTTITKRISSPPAADTTKRVATAGATADAGPFLGGNTWGGSWGSTWGNTWLFGTLLIPGTAASPAIDVTARVGEAAVADNTQRVTASPLGTNITSSMGDVTAITANHTKRVTEAVS